MPSNAVTIHVGAVGALAVIEHKLIVLNRYQGMLPGYQQTFQLEIVAAASPNAELLGGDGDALLSRRITH
jgi:hypothetical protein